MQDYFDSIVAAKIFGGSGGATSAELDKKFDKVGGVITGDVAIQGDLTVSGTTTTEKQKTVIVEDNVLTTNANKVDLKTLLSGIAINKNKDATYAIMYDPADDTVKFGEGTLDKNNKFTFTTSNPIAVRADSADFINAHLVSWDADNNRFVDAGIAPYHIAQLDTENTFIEQQIFNDGITATTANISGNANIQGEAIIDKGASIAGDTNIINGVIKVSATGIDTVTQYKAGAIETDSNGNTANVITIPKETGTLAVTKHSQIKNADASSEKQDTWTTSDIDTTLSVTNVSENTVAGLAVGRDNTALQYINGNIHGRVAVSSETVVLNSTDGEHTNALTISPTQATLNNKALATKDDIKSAEPQYIEISTPQGTLTTEQFNLLQASDTNFILYEHKKFLLNSKGVTSGYLTYTHISYENSRFTSESITITISTKSYVMNIGDIVTNNDTATEGEAGAIRVKDDFSGGLQVATAGSTKGMLSVYRALNEDITSRGNELRPITPYNLNFAVCSALTDANAISPTDDNITTFKTNWKITDSTHTEFGTTLPTVTDYNVDDVYVKTDTRTAYQVTKSGETKQWTAQCTFSAPCWHTAAETTSAGITSSQIILTQIAITARNTHSETGASTIVPDFIVNQKFIVPGYTKATIGVSSVTALCKVKKSTDSTETITAPFYGDISTDSVVGVIFAPTGAVEVSVTVSPDITLESTYLW